tara:strand:+ start:413 stop:583 length:171 start_codon:yes stop_codon:yes gene_type:complete
MCFITQYISLGLCKKCLFRLARVLAGVRVAAYQGFYKAINNVKAQLLNTSMLCFYN